MNMERLRDVTFAAAVHADVLQVYIERLEAVELHMERDARHLASLEQDLLAAQRSAERVSVMSKALASARITSRTGGAMGQHSSSTSSASSSSRVTSTTPISDVLHFAKTAEAFDGESTANDSVMRAIASSEGQLARAEEQLRLAKKSSVAGKLAALERLKYQCKGVDVRALFDNMIRQMQQRKFFSPVTETLVFGRGESSSGGAASSKATQPRENTFGSVAFFEFGQGEMLEVLERSARRLTLRYGDALDALQTSADVFQKQQHSIHQDNENEDRLLSATCFSQALSNSNDESVQLAEYLHQASRRPGGLLGEVEAEYRSMKVACGDPVVPSEDRSRERRRASVLNVEPHIILPSDWSSVEMLETLPRRRVTSKMSDGSRNDNAADDDDDDDDSDAVATAKPPLLPPAKHIITSRFSASDVKELIALEKMRIAVQRRIFDVMQITALSSPNIEAPLKRLLYPRAWAAKPIWPVLALNRRDSSDEDD